MAGKALLPQWVELLVSCFRLALSLSAKYMSALSPPKLNKIVRSDLINGLASLLIVLSWVALTDRAHASYA